MDCCEFKNSLFYTLGSRTANGAYRIPELKPKQEQNTFQFDFFFLLQLLIILFVLYT